MYSLSVLLICSPVIFPKGYFNALCQLQGDKGAKSIVMENLENIVKISIDEAAIDIDTQEDFLRWQQAKWLDDNHVLVLQAQRQADAAVLG